MKEQKQSNALPIILAVSIAATVIGGIAYIVPGGIGQATKTVFQKTPPITTTIEQGYSYDSPQWESIIADIQSKTDETVESFYAPESPTNKNIIFISTSGTTTGEWPNTESTNKIYLYAIKNGELKQIYAEQNNRLLRTMGIEGSKLIIMHDQIDNSPGPCFSIWADWKDFSYLDIENPQILKPYTVPTYQIQKGMDEQKICEAEFGAQERT